MLKAAPKPAAPPLALGVTVGTDDLPGPLGPMPAAMRNPAMLSEAESSDPSLSDDDENEDDENETVGAAVRRATGPRTAAAVHAAASFVCPDCAKVLKNASGLASHKQHCGRPGPSRKEKSRDREAARRADAKRARVAAGAEALAGMHQNDT